MIEIEIPELSESIQEVQVSQWLKKEGEWVERDEEIVELETEKAAQTLTAPEAGVLEKILVPEGEFIDVGTKIAVLNENGTAGAGGASGSSAASQGGGTATAAPPVQDAPSAETASSIMPAAERLLTQYSLSADVVSPTGPGGRLLKEDVARYIEQKGLQPKSAEPVAPAPTAVQPVAPTTLAPTTLAPAADADRTVTTKPMSMIRRTIAKRLVSAQQTAALLTTFNEINMQPVMELRGKYKDAFLKKHGVKLGFMSFFAKASVEALRRFPAVNAAVDGNKIHYHSFQDVGVAIGGGKGLVVPVLRSVEKMSFADVERQIVGFATKAKENTLQPTDLEGGTFTITNGGVYGSLLSTPIINPPQSGILGLHSIQERPVAENGQVVIRPMMYTALTYDHRIVDGREAVQFLKTIKEVLEEPARLFLEV